MTDSDCNNGLNVKIASLRNAGADQADPVRFRYIEVLATRTMAHQGEARRILEAKVEEALLAYGNGAGTKQRASVTAAGTNRRSPLANLVGDLTRQHPEGVAGIPDEHDIARPELRALKQYRTTWSQLSVDRQVKQAFRQGPENAGPLNSHMLLLRSIDLMRKTSPDYLNRFMSYVDTLLWLDQAEKRTRPVTARSAATKIKKR